MIEITVTCNGHADFAEAETAEGAILAARTLFDEAYEREGGAFQPRIVLRLTDDTTITLREGRKP